MGTFLSEVHCPPQINCEAGSPIAVYQYQYYFALVFSDVITLMTSLVFCPRFPWLYRNIHQLHHQHRLPFALAAQDASSYELLSLLLLAMTSAWVVGCHPLSEAVFHLLNTWLAVEDHCGYNLPWATHRLLPFMGGATHHQVHHILYHGNYAPYFTHWDQLFGTRTCIRDVLTHRVSKTGD